MFIMIGANVTTNNGATSSIASPSSSVSTTPNIRSNLHVPSTQMTNTSSTHNNSPKSNCPNNLDVALQAFIQRFVPSDNTTILGKFYKAFHVMLNQCRSPILHKQLHTLYLVLVLYPQ